MPDQTRPGASESAFADPLEQAKVLNARRWLIEKGEEASHRAESIYTSSEGSTVAPNSPASGSSSPGLPILPRAPLTSRALIARSKSTGARQRSQTTVAKAQSHPHPNPHKQEILSTSYVAREDDSTSFIRDTRLYLAISCQSHSTGRDGPLTVLSKLHREEQEHNAVVKDPGWQLHFGQESSSAGSTTRYGRTMKLKASGKGWNPPDLREWRKTADRISAIAHKHIPDLRFREANTYIEILFNVRNHHEHALKMNRLFQAVLKFEWHFESCKAQILNNEGSPDTPQANHSRNPHISHMSLPQLLSHLDSLVLTISTTEDITHIYRTLNDRGPHPNPITYNWHICQNLGEKIRVYATQPLSSDPSSLEKWMAFVFSFVNAAVHCPPERLTRYSDTKEGIERFLAEGERRGKCTLGSGPKETGQSTGSSAALDVVQGLNALNTMDRVYTSHSLWYGSRPSDRKG